VRVSVRWSTCGGWGWADFKRWGYTRGIWPSAFNCSLGAFDLKQYFETLNFLQQSRRLICYKLDVRIEMAYAARTGIDDRRDLVLLTTADT
jgi:hypothetical protein